MVPGFRYHVVTVVAILLSLGLGIMIGYNSAPVKDAIMDRTQSTIDSLNEKFDKQIRAHLEETERQAQFATALTPWLITGKLANKNIVILQTGDYPETARRIREILETAGATVSVLTFDRNFPTRAKTNLSTILPALLAKQPDLPTDSTALLRAISRVLARGGTGELQPLEDARLLHAEGDFSLAHDTAVVVGGASLDNESRAESLDVPLLRLLLQKHVSVVATEPEAAALSYVPMMRDLDVSTVDNADTDIGRIAVVLALVGERGHFGIKGASAILPSPVQE